MTQRIDLVSIDDAIKIATMTDREMHWAGYDYPNAYREAALEKLAEIVKSIREKLEPKSQTSKENV